MKEDVKYLVDDHVEVEENADELTDEQIKPDAVCVIKSDAICDKEDIQVQEAAKTLATADSGIEIDLINEVKRELCQRMDAMIEEKISEITTRRKHNEPIKHGSSSSAITTRTTNFAQTGRTRD